eukprot:948310-Lingulodinium_polyedra.AAC.1
MGGRNGAAEEPPPAPGAAGSGPKHRGHGVDDPIETTPQQPHGGANVDGAPAPGAPARGRTSRRARPGQSKRMA